VAALAVARIKEDVTCKGDKARAMIPGIGLPVSLMRLSMVIVLENSGLSLNVRRVYHVLINLPEHHVLVVHVVIHDLQKVCGDESLYAVLLSWFVQ